MQSFHKMNVNSAAQFSPNSAAKFAVEQGLQLIFPLLWTTPVSGNPSLCTLTSSQ